LLCVYRENANAQQGSLGLHVKKVCLFVVVLSLRDGHLVYLFLFVFLIVFFFHAQHPVVVLLLVAALLQEVGCATAAESALPSGKSTSR
jgi:hypothetical protein